MTYDVRLTSDLRHLQQSTGGKGYGCCGKAWRAQTAVRPACFQNYVEVSCIYRKEQMKANAGALTPKQKQIRFKVVAFTLNIIYKCVQQGNNNFLQDKEECYSWTLPTWFRFRCFRRTTASTIWTFSRFWEWTPRAWNSRQRYFVQGAGVPCTSRRIRQRY